MCDGVFEAEAEEDQIEKQAKCPEDEEADYREFAGCGWFAVHPALSRCFGVSNAAMWMVSFRLSPKRMMHVIMRLIRTGPSGCGSFRLSTSCEGNPPSPSSNQLQSLPRRLRLVFAYSLTMSWLGKKFPAPVGMSIDMRKLSPKSHVTDADL